MTPLQCVRSCETPRTGWTGPEEDADRTEGEKGMTPTLRPVSYTHLTLPTILRV